MTSMPSTDADTPPARRAYLLALLGVAVVSAAGLVAWWSWPREAAAPPLPAANADPRLAPDTPYRNVRPEVKYVGDEACAGCHVDQAAAFRRHPMGRSAAPAEPPGPERFDAASKNPFPAFGYELGVERRNGRVFHTVAHGPREKPVASLEVEARLAIGSAAQGRSYLVTRDGCLFQSPLSWFTPSKAWGLSPGFDEHQVQFERPVTAQCLFCHLSGAEWEGPALNRFRLPESKRLSIGCERCHGPGELHVQAREEYRGLGRVDDTIVNPRNLAPALREAVCEQCHLLGETRIVRRGRQPFDYRPGLPLHAFLSIYVRPPQSADTQKSVSHVQQMHLSRCFRASDGKLGCISCHDPHARPAEGQRVGFYRERCLKCHADPTGCRLPRAERVSQSPQDSCVDCHMPRRSSANIAHAAVTDHRVPRRPGQAVTPPSTDVPTRIPLVHFHGNLVDAQDPQSRRDLALAMIERSRSPAPDAVRQMICGRALPLLDAALAEAPDDVDVQEARGYALAMTNDPALGLAALEELLSRHPERQLAREDAIRAAVRLGRTDDAIAHLRALLKDNPAVADRHRELAVLLMQKQDWPGALEACRTALRLKPAGALAQQLLVHLYLLSGDRKQADAEFERLLQLRPADADGYRRWFEQVSR